MGVFDDKKFEQLDWMTQITETIESELNGLLAQLPDRIEFNVDKVMEHATGSRFSLQSDSVVRKLLADIQGGRLSWEEDSKIVQCFRWEMSPDLELNLATKTMTGTIALVKIIPTFSDEDLIGLMGAKGIQTLSQINFEEEWPLDRMNEMLDVLGKCEEAQRNRSYKKKLNRMRERLQEIFKTNEWRIRDMALADRVGAWIADYIQTGNLAALTTFCKLKVMTHHNMPIYSVEEEK